MSTWPLKTLERRLLESCLCPASGSDVVPSDCLAAHVAARLPEASQLVMSIGGLTRASRGTAKTMIEAVAQGTRVRSNGRIVLARGTPTGTADFGAGPRPTVGVSWGDVATAWHSTGIPNIELVLRGGPQHADCCGHAVLRQAGSRLQRDAAHPSKPRSSDTYRRDRRPSSGHEVER